jgi:hypothetical protein
MKLQFDRACNTNEMESASLSLGSEFMAFWAVMAH